MLLGFILLSVQTAAGASIWYVVRKDYDNQCTRWYKEHPLDA